MAPGAPEASPAVLTPPAEGAAARPGLVLIGALYLTQGVPIGFLFEALPVLLRQQGAGLDALALLPLASLPWIFKFLWAPAVDNRWNTRLGRRRSWIIPMQAILAASLAACALLPPAPGNVLPLLGLFLIGSVASATQDTATDGLAAETLSGARLATANALQAGGMMAGFMLGGGGALILAGAIGYAGALLALTGVVLACLAPTLAWREPPPAHAVERRPARLRHTLRRPGVGLLLLLGLLSGWAQSAGTGLSRLMLTDAGWSLFDLGLLAAAGGGGMILIGAPAGARAVAQHGIWTALGLGFGVALAALGLWLAITAMGDSASTTLPVLATLGLGAGGGIISVAASTLAMRFAARGSQAGTDVTVLQSAQVTGDTASGSLAVALAAAAGYAGAFAGVLALVGLTLALVAVMARHAALRRL